eukprot:TRINITY_DN748_c0_g1_i1.p1 TRINITY_DN748_c0_g1~~TRINITY_DN748_c0_g1_i1.p1  ORF type:complete len:777 (-),score=189.66 TRINITY_DN748_c0_g1_i1:135-2309(-)
MGEGSRKAQGLAKILTSFTKLIHSSDTLFVHFNKTQVQGILKIGSRKLFIAYDGSMKEIDPVCVLDFYVHESVQRGGIGKRLFQFMLRYTRLPALKLAYDRPSPKLIAFLGRHYDLTRYSPQNNNYVVFYDYFEDEEDTPRSKTGIVPVSQRPLTSKKRKPRSLHASYSRTMRPSNSQNIINHHQEQEPKNTLTKSVSSPRFHGSGQTNAYSNNLKNGKPVERIESNRNTVNQLLSSPSPTMNSNNNMMSTSLRAKRTSSSSTTTTTTLPSSSPWNTKSSQRESSFRNNDNNGGISSINSQSSDSTFNSNNYNYNNNNNNNNDDHKKSYTMESSFRNSDKSSSDNKSRHIDAYSSSYSNPPSAISNNFDNNDNIENLTTNMQKTNLNEGTTLTDEYGRIPSKMNSNSLVQPSSSTSTSASGSAMKYSRQSGNSYPFSSPYNDMNQLDTDSMNNTNNNINAKLPPKDPQSGRHSNRRLRTHHRQIFSSEHYSENKRSANISSDVYDDDVEPFSALSSSHNKMIYSEQPIGKPMAEEMDTLSRTASSFNANDGLEFSHNNGTEKRSFSKLPDFSPMEHTRTLPVSSMPPVPSHNFEVGSSYDRDSNISVLEKRRRLLEFAGKPPVSQNSHFKPRPSVLQEAGRRHSGSFRNDRSSSAMSSSHSRQFTSPSPILGTSAASSSRQDIPSIKGSVPHGSSSSLLNRSGALDSGRGSRCSSRRNEHHSLW